MSIEKLEIRLLAKEIVRIEKQIRKIDYYLDVRAADVYEAKKEAFEALKSNSPDHALLLLKFKKLYERWEKGMKNFVPFMNKKQDLTFQLLEVKTLYNTKLFFFEEKERKKNLQ
jgi:hypothetical protein